VGHHPRLRRVRRAGAGAAAVPAHLRQGRLRRAPVDEQLLKALDRKVYLPSGGSLVIDRTEAMVVIDVNTGKFVGKGGNLEETVTRNNLEAAEEIARQLRLRDVGGIIVVDFIDMVLESNRDLVVRRLVECLGRDRTKHQVAEVTSLGLVQMTRKRVGQGLLESFSEPCESCNGRGRRGRGEAARRHRARGPARPGAAGARGRRASRSAVPPSVAAAVRAAGRAPAHDRAWTWAHAAGEPAPVAATEPGLDAAADAVEEAVVEREIAAATTPAPPAAEAAAAPVPDLAVPALPDADDHAHQARPARRRGRVTRGAGAPAATAGEAPAAVVLTVPPEPAVAPPAPAATPAQAPTPAGPPAVAAPPVVTPPAQVAPVEAPAAQVAPDEPAAPRPRRARRTASRPAGPPPTADTPV
jgi:ribonuclease E